MDNYTIFNELGLDINSFSRIDTIFDDNTLYIEATLKRKDNECPYCHSKSLYLKERKRKEIKTTISNTVVYLEIKFPRFECKDCNKTFSQKLDFVFVQKKTKKFIEKVLNECLKMKTYSDIAKELDSSATEIIRIFDKHHPDYRAPLEKIICIDEFSNTKKSESKYACIFVSYKTHKIINILPDRKSEYLNEFLRKQPKKLLEIVECVCIDMYDGYISAVKKFFPNAIIVIDPFHYIRYFTNALQSIRKRIVNDSCSYPDKTRFEKHRRMYTERSEKLPDKNMELYSGESISYYDRINRFIKNNYELNYPYHLLQDFYSTSKTCDFSEGSNLIDNTIRSMENSGIEELIDCAKTWDQYKEYIKNSFKKFDGKRVTNGPIEGINSRIKTYKKILAGYKNYKRFYERIIYIINSKKGKDF